MTTWVNPVKITIIAMYQVGAAQSISVSLVLFARMDRKKSMMYVIINSNVFLGAAIKTLTNAHLSWIVSKNVSEIQTARQGVVRLTTALLLPHATQEEKLKMIIVIQAASVKVCCVFRTSAPLKNNPTHRLLGSVLESYLLL